MLTNLDRSAHVVNGFVYISPIISTAVVRARFILSIFIECHTAEALTKP